MDTHKAESEIKSKKKKRKPRCALCLNHGKESRNKGHKRVCKFRRCSCIKCARTLIRRDYMSDMQYMKRNGLVEASRIGKKADMTAIYNERMKSKLNKRVNLEILTFLRGELGLTCEDEMISTLLIALVQECDTNDPTTIIQEIINVCKEI